MGLEANKLSVDMKTFTTHPISKMFKYCNGTICGKGKLEGAVKEKKGKGHVLHAYQVQSFH